MADEPKVDKVKEALFRKSAVVKRVLATPDGWELFQILRREFGSRLDDAKDERQTVFKAGQADPVLYLMQLNYLNEEGK